MKKKLFLWVILALWLAVSACNGNKGSISGEVVEVTPSALILETTEGKRAAVLLDEDTYVLGMDDMDGERYKAAPHTGVRVSFFDKRRAKSVTAADGKRVKAYRAEALIRIEGYLISEAAVLADGTVLDAWKTDAFGTTYQTREGIELLWEDGPSGPENYHVVNLESFDDLGEGAKPKVSAFYEAQGKLYDLQGELERAWRAYRDDPRDFSAFVVRQETFPAASARRIMYFSTKLTQTVSGNIVEENTLCAAFDRESGENIPLADLFTCPEEVLGERLLSIAAREGSAPAEAAVQKEMKDAFRMEGLSVSQTELWMEFPQGTLPSQKNTYLVSVAWNDAVKELMQPWAIPESSGT